MLEPWNSEEEYRAIRVDKEYSHRNVFGSCTAIFKRKLINVRM
jgi:hypothetical protein